MKTMPLCILTLLAAAVTFGCDSKPLTTLAAVASSPNSPLAQAAETVTNTLFETEQPVFNAAISGMPADVQALAQMAYVALDQAVVAAEKQGLRLLAVNGNITTQSVATDLAEVRDILHGAIHDPNAPLANSNDIIADPNLAAIPTITVPNIP